MFFFFFFFGVNTNKVSFRITFEAPKGENPSLEEFNEFLDSLGKMHEQVILHTQPEYFGNQPLSALQILDYHKLKIEKLCRKNPFDITLTFQIIQEGLITYWPIIKALFMFCKRYGKNAESLDNTIQGMEYLFYDLYEKLYKSNIFPDLKKDEILDKIRKSFTRMYTSKTFRLNYDKFCKAGIRITELISTIELGDTLINHDFIEGS